MLVIRYTCVLGVIWYAIIVESICPSHSLTSACAVRLLWYQYLPFPRRGRKCISGWTTRADPLTAGNYKCAWVCVYMCFQWMCRLFVSVISHLLPSASLAELGQRFPGQCNHQHFVFVPCCVKSKVLQCIDFVGWMTGRTSGPAVVKCCSS